MRTPCRWLSPTARTNDSISPTDPDRAGRRVARRHDGQGRHARSATTPCGVECVSRSGSACGTCSTALAAPSVPLEELVASDLEVADRCGDGLWPERLARMAMPHDHLPGAVGDLELRRVLAPEVSAEVTEEVDELLVAELGKFGRARRRRASRRAPWTGCPDGVHPVLPDTSG